MRQLIVFPVEDERTLARLKSIAGDVDRWQHGLGNSVTDMDRTSDSINWSQQRSALISGSLLRGLKRNQAVALLQIDNTGYDDVIDCTPLYLPSPTQTRDEPAPASTHQTTTGTYSENSSTRADTERASSAVSDLNPPS